MKQFTTFYVGDTFFGVDILQVKEINSQLRYTPVPDSANYIKGLLNLRGQIITIFDLAKRLGRDNSEIISTTRNLVLKTDSETYPLREQGKLNTLIGNDAVGFLIDRIGDVIEVEDDRIDATPANVQNVAKEFIDGVIELENDLLILLNVSELVEYKVAK